MTTFKMRSNNVDASRKKLCPCFTSTDWSDNAKPSRSFQIVGFMRIKLAVLDKMELWHTIRWFEIVDDRNFDRVKQLHTTRHDSERTSREEQKLFTAGRMLLLYNKTEKKGKERTDKDETTIRTVALLPPQFWGNKKKRCSQCRKQKWDGQLKLS